LGQALGHGTEGVLVYEMPFLKWEGSPAGLTIPFNPSK